MFNAIKQIESCYEERMGYAHVDSMKVRGIVSLTGLIIKALFSIAREVDELKKEVFLRNGKSD